MSIHRRLGGVWILFALIFGLLATYHFRISTSVTPHIPTTQINEGGVTIKLNSISIDKPLQDFAKDFNKYVDAQDASASTTNIISGFGYFAACLTAIFSAYIELVVNAGRGIDKADRNYNDTDHSKNIWITRKENAAPADQQAQSSHNGDLDGRI